VEELARQYWGAKCLFFWWDYLVRNFDRRFERAVSFLPILQSTRPAQTQKHNQIAQALPGLKEKLERLEDELRNQSDYRYLIDREPETRRNDIQIAAVINAPEFVKNFIDGEPCREGEMKIVIEHLISYFAATLESSQPTR